MKTETSAKGVKGYIIHFDGKYYFRVYDKKDKKIFTDYLISHYDLAVKIVDNRASLLTNEKGAFLDYDFRALRQPPRADEPTKKQLRQWKKCKNAITVVTDGKGNVIRVIKKQKTIQGDEAVKLAKKLNFEYGPPADKDERKSKGKRK
jgi:hypothetical protein